MKAKNKEEDFSVREGQSYDRPIVVSSEDDDGDLSSCNVRSNVKNVTSWN